MKNNTNQEQSELKELVAFAKENHERYRHPLLMALQDYEKQDLILFALTELELKNDAYYFIVENGLLSDFKDYMKT